MSNSCDSMDCSPPGSSVHGISQAWILQWVAIFSSGRSSWPRDRTHISCIGRSDLYQWATREACYKTKQNLLNFFTQSLFIASLWHSLMQGIGEGDASHPQSFRELDFLDDGDQHHLAPRSPQLWTKWKGYTSLLLMRCYSWIWKWSRSVMYDSLWPHGLTGAYQAPPSMGFSRQEYWRGLPFPYSRVAPPNCKRCR